MVYSVPHYLVAMGGPLFGGPEAWTITFRLSLNFSDPAGPQDEAPALNALQQHVATWFPASRIKDNARLDWVKYNRIGVDGRYAFQWTNLHEYNPPIAATSSGAAHPPQVSQVLTLHTEFTRGLASRGRVFLPVPAALVGGDGRIAAADATAAATAFANLLTAINADPDLGRARVFSFTRAGAAQDIIGVTSGRTLDTMRSRRTSLPEEPPAMVTVAGS